MDRYTDRHVGIRIDRGWKREKKRGRKMYMYYASTYPIVFQQMIKSYPLNHPHITHHTTSHHSLLSAFDRTGRIINITVAPINNYDPPRLLNYLTAPHVCVWSAAAASCAVPGLFDSITLIVKEPNGKNVIL